MDVHLLVYDLSNGMARQMSMALLGFQLDAVYHTSIELDGTEWVYDGGINTIRPGTSHLGQPLQRIHLGKTQLPMEVIIEYVDSLRDIFTAQAYDLFKHNCNNFSNDFATFLVGKGIPEHISNMPNAVLESPFGKMMLPQLEQMVQAKKAQQGGLLGIQTDPRAGPAGAASSSAPRPVVETNGGHHLGHAMGTVRSVSTMRQLDSLLEGAKKTCAVIFFTSATCPPCKTLYPLYDQLAAELGDKATLIKVDTSLAFDIGQQYSISATPTFITFLKGEQQERWMGADASRLRGNVGLLAQMATPSHPHQMLNLSRFADPEARPVLYEKIPPLDKLMAKMGSDDPAVLGLKHFIETRKAEVRLQRRFPTCTDSPTILTTP
ncbi:PUL domain-containing protein [Apiospora kogelbergensis]|uniref:PUL domain-containing protein n=1 Tax=Apiospora kogelbergensis TaxID=1337665 RepID=UPI00312E2B37